MYTSIKIELLLPKLTFTSLHFTIYYNYLNIKIKLLIKQLKIIKRILYYQNYFEYSIFLSNWLSTTYMI